MTTNIQFEEILRHMAGKHCPYEKLVQKTKERFGPEIGGMIPSFSLFESNFALKLFRSAKKARHISDTRFSPSANVCTNFINNNQLFFPNAHGLVVLEHWDRAFDFIPIDTFVMGLDHLPNLFWAKQFGHKVPYLIKDSKGIYRYASHPYGFQLDHDELILAIDWRL